MNVSGWMQCFGSGSFRILAISHVQLNEAAQLWGSKFNIIVLKRMPRRWKSGFGNSFIWSWGPLMYLNVSINYHRHCLCSLENVLYIVHSVEHHILMSAGQSFVHGMCSSLQANVVHLCSGYIIHNYLLAQESFLIQFLAPIPSWSGATQKDRAVNVASISPIGKDTVHTLFPIIPVVVRQWLRSGSLFYGHIFFSTN